MRALAYLGISGYDTTYTLRVKPDHGPVPASEKNTLLAPEPITERSRRRSYRLAVSCRALRCLKSVGSRKWPALVSGYKTDLKVNSVKDVASTFRRCVVGVRSSRGSHSFAISPHVGFQGLRTKANIVICIHKTLPPKYISAVRRVRKSNYVRWKFSDLHLSLLFRCKNLTSEREHFAFGITLHSHFNGLSAFSSGKYRL